MHQMMNVWGGGRAKAQLVRYLLHIYLKIKNSQVMQR